MVARLADMPASRAPDNIAAPGSVYPVAGHDDARLALRGHLLLERASQLKGVRPGRRGTSPMAGIPLYIDEAFCREREDLFLNDHMFAVIADDGSLCLRLPRDIAEDLEFNGLVWRAGANLVTWPIQSARTLETTWRILLHTYWAVSRMPEGHARRMWSEWVINH